ncbi:putative bifunctional diguanylate cyclase/phosphodiesterase [Alteromonas gilva]|uniref:EAL domain-containing protein n=1 Tax=Alteromonas gilva TaxID=2987522 RepID=A0ABT5L1F8_9ALTE|nr:EAL domain-containing protein [Alteromonas gilva]MDC8830306.1 EAL domain-containing protein [Alteromonas gilva]
MPQSPEPQVLYSKTREVVELLYRNSFSGLIVTLLGVSVLAFGFGTPVKNNIKLTIWVLMVVVCLIRGFDSAYWFLRLRKGQYNARWPLFRFISGATITACLWATYVVSLYPYMTLPELTTAMIIISAMAGGAATILAPHLPLVMLYTTLMILPLSLRAVFDSHEDFNLIGMLGIVFWLAMLNAAKKANKFICQAIDIKYQKEELVALMRQERNEVDRVNKELIEANKKLDNANNSLEQKVERRTIELHKLSSIDPLTGLLNRTGFMLHFNELINNSAINQYSMAVLFIDLDGFKQINDSLGHKAGDIVLSEVSSKLVQYCEPDCIGRWGGDEFIILLPHANAESASAIALAIASSLTNLNPINESNVSLGATIGIAVYPTDSDDPATLIQLADLTMYHQKNIAPGKVGLYSEALYEKMRHDQQLREGLWQAIEKHQLSVMYQPIIDLRTNDLWAVEALARWQFEGEWVRPDEFIPLAEQSGAINAIGTWIMHRACIDAAQWEDKNIGVSINVSVLQLLNENFISQVDRALNSSGLSPERLHLEVTESIFADDTAVLTARINALKSRQIKVAIDDFGTGFSSLKLLQSLDFDLIKIDRSFVTKLTDCNDTIVKATLLMAKEFGCKTVAEGVETQEQASLLKTMGVDYLQGYLFARPLKKKDFDEWYTNWQKTK